MIVLDESGLVGTGYHRQCFEDPRDSGRCIKVVIKGTGAENRREESFYRILNRKNISWAGIPRYYGKVQTDRGEGMVFDLIRDADGSPSRTLESYLSDPDARPGPHELQRLLNELRQYLLENGITTMTIKPANIVLQKRTADPDRLVIIDNLGCSEVLPLSYHIRFFARRKTNRRFDRFETKLWQQYDRQ